MGALNAVKQPCGLCGRETWSEVVVCKVCVAGHDAPSARGLTPADILDVGEVAELLGVSASSVRVALSAPENHPGLAARLPDPLRRVGNAWVWARADLETEL